MILGKSPPYFWSRLLLSVIAIFALPNTQSLENNRAENCSSEISIQQVLESAKVVRYVQRPSPQAFPANYFEKKQPDFQPHFVVAVLNRQAPIRAGPLLI
ncbi:hypothetical protein BKK49_02455 [Rodentibacter rarus]|uniref:DUF2547 family protein n=1 Tax=Rodentibacter rarus TaxID=1908260 RepID=A0A1V3ILB8_9PAST|nr:secA translation cis-regulator SecM [Rodentibacter rarus]OOF42456.1 hypothetical protein BKK49_02455 [Rodentibacter rarus]OOF42717.1 hypothetical protein BKK50_06260 [Rodentibacter rarus]